MDGNRHEAEVYDNEALDLHGDEPNQTDDAKSQTAPPPTVSDLSNQKGFSVPLARFDNPAFDGGCDVITDENPAENLAKPNPKVVDSQSSTHHMSLLETIKQKLKGRSRGGSERSANGRTATDSKENMGNVMLRLQKGASNGKMDDGKLLTDGVGNNFKVEKISPTSNDLSNTFVNSNDTKVLNIPDNTEQQLLLKDAPSRETWGKKMDFLLSVIGFAVDLGNVWRFPYICYRNGGGAFLVPYFVMLIFGGLPLFYMELALGQFQRVGCISVWSRICPMFKGIGFGICFIAFYVSSYYNTIIAWALYFMFASMRAEVPWARCGHDWNTENCTEFFNRTAEASNYSKSPAEEFFKRSVLEVHRSTGIDDIGPVKWSITLCLMAVFFMVYFSLWKGIKSSGKAVWITATAPYIILIILLIRGVTLPGALDGIIYYLNPTWDRLYDIRVWNDAASQIFFSLGPGFGVLLALSSYNKFNNNCYRDALITSSINCFTSFLSGFVVFSVLGYMAFSQGKTVDKVAEDGPGLVFVAYPEAIATLNMSSFWAIIFFLMLITLGLDSTFGGLEALITGICDEWPALGRRREIFVAGLISASFLGSLATTTYGGNYVLNLLDQHGVPISILFIVFVEAIALNWFYGVNRFCDDIQMMLGYRPGLYWRVCWAGISPIFIFVLFILTCVNYSGIYYPGYKYPYWATIVGWLITCSSIFCIPIYIVYKFAITPGTFLQIMIVLSFWGYDGIRPPTPGYVYPYWAEALGWLITASSVSCIPIYLVYKFIVTPGTFKERIKTITRPETHPNLDDNLPLATVYL